MKSLLAACLILFSFGAVFAMESKNDGTRIFYVGAVGDFSSIADLIWVHPVGITAGDTLRSRGQVLNEDFIAQASGTVSLPITISIGAMSLADGGYQYLRFAYSISDNATGDAISITAVNNVVWNCTIYNPVGDGVELTANAEIKNVIFEGVGDQDINENGGVATVDGNYASAAGNPLLGADFRIPLTSPAYGTGVFITGLHDAAGATDGFNTVLQPQTGRYIFDQLPSIGAHQPLDKKPQLVPLIGNKTKLFTR